MASNRINYLGMSGCVIDLTEKQENNSNGTIQKDPDNHSSIGFIKYDYNNDLSNFDEFSY